MLEGGYSSLVTRQNSIVVHEDTRACTPISVYHLEDMENKACSSRKTIGVHSVILPFYIKKKKKKNIKTCMASSMNEIREGY